MGKGKKAIIIVSVITASLAVLYVGGGYVAGLIVLDSLFNKRWEKNDNADFQHAVLKIKDDYPSLSSPEEVHFKGGDVTYAGYYYHVPSPKGLVVAVHGINGDSFSPFCGVSDHFILASYDVFAFDLSVCGKSDGKGALGLQQSAIDVSYAVDYLASRKDIALDNLIFAGYSWGAYGITASLALDLKAYPKSVIAFSGFDSPFEEMMGMAKRYAGNIVEGSRFQLDWALRTRCGELGYLSALEGMKKHPEVAYYLIQGQKDVTVPYEVSIYSSAKRSKVSFTGFLKESFGHTGIWLEPSSLERYEEAWRYYKTIQGHKDEAELLADYVALAGGKEAFSKLDSSLFQTIDSALDA